MISVRTSAKPSVCPPPRPRELGRDAFQLGSLSSPLVRNHRQRQLPNCPARKDLDLHQPYAGAAPADQAARGSDLSFEDLASRTLGRTAIR